MTSLKERLILINKYFSNGTLRYDGEFERIESLSPIDIAKEIAKNHWFVDGNKRTAIKYLELYYNQNVPYFVYEVLEVS